MVHSEQVMRRFLQPTFVQRQAAAQVGRAGSRLAGAQIEIHINVDAGLVQAGFKAYGCPATVAAADLLAEQLTGTDPAAHKPDRHALINALALSPSRQHCAALAIEAMHNAFSA